MSKIKQLRQNPIAISKTSVSIDIGLCVKTSKLFFKKALQHVFIQKLCSLVILSIRIKHSVLQNVLLYTSFTEKLL